MYTIDGIMNRFLATAPIERFQSTPAERPSTYAHAGAGLHLKQPCFNLRLRVHERLSHFQTTDYGGRREELPTLLAVNTGALNWDLPLVDLGSRRRNHGIEYVVSDSVDVR